MSAHCSPKAAYEFRVKMIVAIIFIGLFVLSLAMVIYYAKADQLKRSGSSVRVGEIHLARF